MNSEWLALVEGGEGRLAGEGCRLESKLVVELSKPVGEHAHEYTRHASRGWDVSGGGVTVGAAM